jgi:DNA-binding XRE family transcriptional regulator
MWLAVIWAKRQRLQRHAAQSAERGSMKPNKSTAVSCAKQMRQNERVDSLLVRLRSPIRVLSRLGSHHLRYFARDAMTATEYKATRERLGTQAEVAAMLGVNRVTVAKRENGTMTITNEAVLAIQSLRKLKRKPKSENVPNQAP